MLEKLLPLCFSAIGERVTPNDNSYTEYYDIRRSSSGADVIAVGIDFSCAESYTLMTDLIVSIKHTTDVGTVLFDTDEGQDMIVKILSSSAGYERGSYIEQLRRDTEYSDAFYSFLAALGELNDKYPPQRRLSCRVVDLPARSDEEASAAARASALYEAAQKAAAGTGRAVFVIADTADMDDGSPLRAESEELFPLLCLYRSAYIGDETSICVVDRSRLSFFDRMYSAASTHSTGVRMTPHYSEEHLTAYFFVIRNPSYVQHTPCDGEDE